eukprot:TRINITY_DN729_c0_g1_i2.p2 TRINITY_DN729_c0_g1~~TRINITY_DN729_c0_g1_i2.p2  ORF type:complete len:478 (+),score=114.24 TRINITY_DN729_c0_g1_i2:1825-3258(+)
MIRLFSRAFPRLHPTRVPYTCRALSQAATDALGAGPLTDTFMRRHTYLRVSLTERCNLRCQYCMPEEGVPLSPTSQIMTSDEIYRVCKVFVASGVTKIRFTGGEPLVRKDAEDIIEHVGTLRAQGLRDIGLTTNALLLERKLPRLYKAGLNSLNISLDTLRKDRFTNVTRRLGFEKVISAIDTVLHSGRYHFSPLKINCVVMRDVNDDELLDFVALTEKEDVEIRFIEYMPFDGNKWKDSKMVGFIEMKERIRKRYPTLARSPAGPNDTSKTYHIPGFKGRIGFISSMSDAFCSTCNRLRVTADGNLKVCLFGNNEVSLRDAMRSGSSDAELLALIGGAVKNKKAAHAGMMTIMYMSRDKNEGLTHSFTVSRKRNAPLLKFARGMCTTSRSPAPVLSHVDHITNMPTMVDVSKKTVTTRTAVGRSIIHFPLGVLQQLAGHDDINNVQEIKGRKGPIFSTAIVAGTLAVKSTSQLIPF